MPTESAVEMVICSSTDLVLEAAEDSNISVAYGTFLDVCFETLL